MFITVAITTWCVPFDQTIKEIRTFGGDSAAEAARQFINAESRKWWDENEGERCLAEKLPHGGCEPYEPIAELAYNHPRYELWGGEQGFHAMIDASSYAKLTNEHYAKRVAEGHPVPGYLVNTQIAGHWPQE